MVRKFRKLSFVKNKKMAHKYIHMYVFTKIIKQLKKCAKIKNKNDQRFLKNRKIKKKIQNNGTKI